MLLGLVFSHPRVFYTVINFILFRLIGRDAGRVFESIRDAGVLIKNMNAQTGALENCLRVTVGKPEENTAFLAALGEALSV